MDFGYTDKVKELQERLSAFMAREIAPRDRSWHEQAEAGRFPPDFYWDLKNQAFEEGLWNMFLPGLQDDEPGTRCTNLESAKLGRAAGRARGGQYVEM